MEVQHSCSSESSIVQNHNIVVFAQVEHPNTCTPLNKTLHFISFTQVENNNFAVKHSDMVISAHFALNQRPHKKHNLKGTRPLFKKYIQFPNIEFYTVVVEKRGN